MNPDCFVIFICFNVVLAWDYGLHGADWESCSGDRQSPIDIISADTRYFDIIKTHQIKGSLSVSVFLGGNLS